MALKPSGALGVQAALAFWVLAFALSFLLAWQLEPDGSGFTRGMNRVGALFRWQFISFAAALIAWLIARNNNDLSPRLARLARLPIMIQCLLGFVGAGVVVFALVFK